MPIVPQLGPPRGHLAVGLAAHINWQVGILWTCERYVDPSLLVASPIVALEDLERYAVRDEHGTSDRVGPPEEVGHVTADRSGGRWPAEEIDGTSLRIAPCEDACVAALGFRQSPVHHVDRCGLISPAEHAVQIV